MQPLRPTFRTATLLVVGAAIATFTLTRLGLSSGVARLVSGESYRVECVGDQATLDLHFEENSRYALIVASLSEQLRSFRIELQAESIDKQRRLAAYRVDALPMEQRHWGFLAARTSGPMRAASAMPDLKSCKDAISDRQPATREFYVHVTDGDLNDPKQYACVSGHKVAEGEQVRVFLDGRQSRDELTPGVLDEIVHMYDRRIIPTFRKKLGWYRDVDGDGKFLILMTPWLGRLQGGRTSLGGFVRGSDFRSDVERPFSNHCDMLYLNSSVRPGPHLEALLAHEFAHAVCFSQRLPSERKLHGLPVEEDWLNEAIAHVAERFAGSSWTNLDYRVSRYLNETSAYPLVVADYYRAGLWREHGCRGATFLFLRWFVDVFGEQSLNRLIHSPLVGTRNLERASGVTFEELFRAWTIAVCQSGRSIGVASRNFRQDAAAHSQGRRLQLLSLKPYDAPKGSGRVASESADLRSIDLCGRLGRFGLAGPRAKIWDVDKSDRVSQVKGTAAAYYELTASGQPGARRIRIVGEPGTRLQVSLIKLPAERPFIEIAAGWAALDSASADDSSSSTMSHADAVPLLHVWVRRHAGAFLKIETIACEQNRGETRRSKCYGAEELKKLRLATDDSPADGGMELFRLPRQKVQPEDGPLVVKVVACDERGCRAVGWTTIGAFDSEGRRLQLAGLSSGSDTGD